MSSNLHPSVLNAPAPSKRKKPSNVIPTLRYINPDALCQCGKKPYTKAKYCCGVNGVITKMPGLKLGAMSK